MEDREIRVMTIDEVKANPPALDKKFILINSLLYTNEAFEYILDLINETDCVAFIRDLKKIYTHGEFFGGDVWEENLLCFGSFQLLNNDDEFIAELGAERIDDKIRFKGDNNIILTADEYFVNNEKLKTITIGYDISNSIDTSEFLIDDATARYNLNIIDGKIGVERYIPIRVEVSGDTTPIEYDHTPKNIEFNLSVYGSSQNKNIFVTSGSNETITVSDDNSIVTATISPNTNTNYLVIYSDEKTEGSVMFEKKFGFGLFYSNEQITINTVLSNDKIISLNSCNCEFTIDQEDNKYGWFACPSIYHPIFKDTYSGLCGGWQKIYNIRVYSNNLEYTVWKTEQSGLGEVHWAVNEK